MILRCLAAGLPAEWVAADEAFGMDWRFRRMLEELQVGYVLAVPKSQNVPRGGRIETLIGRAPAEAWVRLSAGDGAKGPRLYDWAAAGMPFLPDFDIDPPTHRRWVLARRSISEPTEIAYYLAYAPFGTTVAELVTVAGLRWSIEDCFGAAKNECGLDQYEVRRYLSWYRHITLAMLAFAFLAVLAADAPQKGGNRSSADVIDYTVAEIRRLLGAVLPQHDRHGLDHLLTWSHWRRRHQATARRCHYRRRQNSSSQAETRLEY